MPFLYMKFLYFYRKQSHGHAATALATLDFLVTVSRVWPDLNGDSLGYGLLHCISPLLYFYRKQSHGHAATALATLDFLVTVSRVWPDLNGDSLGYGLLHCISPLA